MSRQHRSRSRTWWGERFIAALEGFMDEGRLERGRSYSGDSRILAFAIDDARVTATVRGNVNPYFGVYKEPRYKVEIRLAPLAEKDWSRAIQAIGTRAAFVAKLLTGQMPDDIETAFKGAKHTLLPAHENDFARAECSCPDWVRPCKHIAGVYYRLAGMLDHDPLLLFELRGIRRDRLRETLAETPLGQALVGLMDDDGLVPEPVESLFARPQSAAEPSPDFERFWHGKHPVPSRIEPIAPAEIPAILVRKGGDNPPFWDQDASFIELMKALYLRVRTKNKDRL
jgi:uncharacterized Zn finger protein